MSRVLADPVGEAIAAGVRECYEQGIDPETWGDDGYVVGDLIRDALDGAGYRIVQRAIDARDIERLGVV